MDSDDVARACIAEGQRRNISPRGIQIALATELVESNCTIYANPKVPESMSIPHDAEGTDGFSVGPMQQQVVFENGAYWWGDAATCMDPTKSAGLFYDRLVRLNYDDPNTSPGTFAQDVQSSAFPDRYDERFGDAVDLYNRLVGSANVPPPPPAPAGPRPDFNEYSDWCENSQDRSGTDIDLWLIHTQEGGGGDNAAQDLTDFLKASTGGPNPVSYHYAGSQASDGGVTVIDVVDTDLACWAVGNSNDRSINFCFAGSSINWSRDQWMGQSKAIEAAAFLCVQDCMKYPKLAAKLIAPPYNSDPPGVSDHRYCTDHLRDGNTHTDVGDNFPWDYFGTMVDKWWKLLHNAPDPIVPQPLPTPAQGGTKVPSNTGDGDFDNLINNGTDRDVLNYIAGQLGPGDPGWPSTDKPAKTLRDKLWHSVTSAVAGVAHVAGQPAPPVVPPKYKKDK
jgi:hypothetical protein